VIRVEYRSPQAAHDELIKEGEEKIGTNHSAAVRDEPEADEKLNG
jgi:hypothetical protein